MCYIPATHILTTAQLTINHAGSADMDIDMNIVAAGAIGGCVACIFGLLAICWVGKLRNDAKRARETQQFLEDAQARERQHQQARTVEVEAVVVMST